MNLIILKKKNHEGRIKMKKNEKIIVSAFEQSIWQTTARLFYGEITKNQVQNDMERLFDSKCKKK